MNFYCYTKKEDLTCSKRGIWEPIPNEEVILEDALMIMPLVAFDAEKNRIGYGGGYYDKYLKVHKNHKKIAIAFEDQLVSHIEPEEHDRKPDYIITETRIIK